VAVTPSASYSFTIRIEIKSRPGMRGSEGAVEAPSDELR
jgi:hypothetical protein